MPLKFSQFFEPTQLDEADEMASGGVKHLTHIEDAILLNGSVGIKLATDYMQKVVDSMSSNDASYCVTTKFDGSPALVTGINPENGKFFVGTKSVFNKTPKLNYTDKDIDTNHPSGGLNVKLKIALKHLKGVGIQGIMQGDMLFTKEDIKSQKIDGRQYVTFRPNTLTYAVPSDSDLAKEIQVAEMGIVFHTKYTGNEIANLSPSFAPDISYLKKSSKAWIIDANLQSVGSCSLPMNALQKKEIELQIAAISRNGAKNAKFLDKLQQSQGIINDLMIYINHFVRQGVAQGSSQGFLDYMKTKTKKDIDKLKQGDARTAKANAAKTLIDSIESNTTKYNGLFALHHLISTTKLLIIERLRQTKMRLDAFTQENDKLTVSSPEGFVVVNKINNQAYKLVDRLDFSRKNFNLPKTW